MHSIMTLQPVLVRHVVRLTSGGQMEPRLTSMTPGRNKSGHTVEDYVELYYLMCFQSQAQGCMDFRAILAAILSAQQHVTMKVTTTRLHVLTPKSPMDSLT